MPLVPGRVANVSKSPSDEDEGIGFVGLRNRRPKRTSRSGRLQPPPTGASRGGELYAKLAYISAWRSREGAA
jgi:hypothetical protein